MPDSRCELISNANARSCLLRGVLMASVVSIATAPSFSDQGSNRRAADDAAPAKASRSSDVVSPIYYPHSPRERLERMRRDGETDRLLDAFLHWHSTTQYEAALEVIDALVEREPDNAVMHYNRACVLGRLLRTEEAIDALERAIELGWRNLSHMQVDPDLHAIRWHDRYTTLFDHLAAKIRREQPRPGPLRDDSWEAVVRDLQAVVPNLLVSNHVPAVTISLVHDGEHVWNGAFRSAGQAGDSDESRHVDRAIDPDRTVRVEGPAKLLGMLGVLERWEGQAEPGVVRMVELCRHAAKTEMASSRSTRPAGRQMRRQADHHAGQQGAAGPFSPSARESGQPSQRIVGGRVLRVSHVPDDVHDLFRMTIEYLSGDSFIRYCRERAFPAIGMNRSEILAVGEHRARRARRASNEVDRGGQAVERRERGTGPPRLVLETTADDLAALVSHVLNLERVPRKQKLDWHQISDHLLRSCVTRELSIGSGIRIRRTPFGIRTDVVSVGGGSGYVMRWYPRSGSGVVVLFEEDAEGAGRRTAERIAHLALGGQP